MNAPAVSVILPAYNCEKYIGKAIESVLQQTFKNFELIIINDGSADNTEFIILSYTDQRIVYLKNKENKGLIYTLNSAIEIAQGKYIARMDADDICQPERLAKQKDLLERNNDVAVVACTIDFINDKEEKTGSWELDRKTITAKQIRRQMPYANCIAHPSVMMLADVIKDMKYDSTQVNIEDYDLWLRILNKGLNIVKLNEPLLQYRLHDKSVTNLYLKNKNPFFKHAAMKLTLLKKNTFTGFSIRIITSMIIDLIKGFVKAIKNAFS